MSSKTGKSTAYSLFSLYKSLAEYVTPMPTQSSFLTQGTLTPDEFVSAGDLLVSKCPTWKWCSGDPLKHRAYLPASKQYLKTVGVPCATRANELCSGNFDDEGQDGEWTNTYASHESVVHDVDIPGNSQSSNPAAGTASQNGRGASAEQGEHRHNQVDEEEDIPDIDEFAGTDNLVTMTDDGTIVTSNLVRTRTYDLSIVYDKFYSTPRLYLYGYNEDGQPLTASEVLEDVYADYALKTVTMEQHPHESVSCASIHPCKHAQVMKKMCENLGEEGEYPRVDLYLFLFLKFVSGVIPTINYDFTVAM
eukprot:ANDGO_01123.mRNA.1 Autophagy-related protein 3